MGRHVLTFVLSEVLAYGYHRAIHRTDAHLAHHSRPDDLRTLSHLSLLSGTVCTALSCGLRTGWTPLVYWSAITVAHPVLHHHRFGWWPMNYVQRRHDVHHAVGTVNYGPVTPFMDMICGTEAADYFHFAAERRP